MKRILALFLTVACLSANAADLTVLWQPNPVGPAASSYRVYWAQGLTAPFVLYGSTTNTALTVTNVIGGTYRFTVSGVNAFGEGPQATPVTFTGSAPGAPISITISVTVTSP